ncbi:NAD(P)/FAD-dependent oxidoreductase [Parasphingopyxis lamellibrachiae]|uniref:D-arginine dehydrogenase n=1 Tax=Parasphingopyxis lamellibrachiae TaxID=680125 RepID=A0A3D9FBS5_9SPHN|nr:FAD-dependent oxidoreductase [Parasphingopyxis lamellibrachiae]RED15269.1 D-arginine dehydrogenase [Parasphingopyxis lamellibrachiae]
MIYDFAIVGAGMAGASLAAELAPAGTVLILEAEDFPGYHATGRSAAFWSETYGGPSVQPLTSASHGFLAEPPAAFSKRPFLDPSGALHIADQSGYARLDRLAAEFAASDVTLEHASPAALVALCPGLRSGWDRAIWEPSCADIDVGGLHQAYLRAAQAHGAQLRCSAPATAIEPRKGCWRVFAGKEWVEAAVIINAAGAWADRVAAMAGARKMGVAPYRRTVIQLRTDPAAPENLPLVIDAAGKFYFKSEGAGRIWLSPHDETPAKPGDAAPEEIDIAYAIDRFEKAVDWKVLAVEKKWAGLRSFAGDRLPVYGFDPEAPGFFWCAGQGGFGIQTAPAGAMLCRSLLIGDAKPALLAGVEADRYSPGRFA